MDTVALTRRNGSTDLECVETFLTHLILDRPEVRVAFPVRKACPTSVFHSAAALWLAVADDTDTLTAELVLVEYWRFGKENLMLQYTAIPEYMRPCEPPPVALVDMLDASSMPRHWPVSTALQVRSWRDAVLRQA